MPAKLVFYTFLYPWQKIRMAITDGMPYAFHEFGCYLNWFGLLLIFIALFQRSWSKKNKAFLLLFILWFWIGTGWGGLFNPWKLMQHLPIINQAHLQSRTFILLYLFFVILVSNALELLRKRYVVYSLVALGIIVESFFVRLHITGFLNEPTHQLAPTRLMLMEHDNLDYTADHGYSVRHVLTRNAGILDCNDRSLLISSVRSNEMPDYKGEIQVLKGEGTARIERYTPGKLHIAYDGKTELEIAVNTNYLWGWTADKREAKILSKQFGELVRFEIPKGQGVVTFTYSPRYFWPCVVMYLLGIFLFLRELVTLIKQLPALQQT